MPSLAKEFLSLAALVAFGVMVVTAAICIAH